MGTANFYLGKKQVEVMDGIRDFPEGCPKAARRLTEG